jgi:hypothetical protein
MGEPLGRSRLTVKTSCRSFGKNEVPMERQSTTPAPRMMRAAATERNRWAMHHSTKVL